MQTPQRILMTCSVAALLFVSSCRKQATVIGHASPSTSGPHDPDLQVNAAGYHGRLFTGPLYLPRSSPLEDGTTAYNVTYQHGVTVVSGFDTQRHLLAIQADGTYLFDSTAGQVAKLKAGSVVLLSGLALRTVVEVQKTAAGYRLKTEPAMITDAIKEGLLEGTYKIDFSRMLGKSPAVAIGTAEFDYDFSGYNYHVTFTPANDHIDLRATIKFGGSQGVLAYEGVGSISNFVSTIRMQIHDGHLTRLDFDNANFAGHAELKWFAASSSALKAGSMARITSWPAELLKIKLLSRAAYHVPILVGAVPFDLRISLGFSFIPAFTSTNSVVEGSKLIQYEGAGGFNFANGQTRPFGAVNVQGNANPHDDRVVAGGPVGFTAATEAPRLDLALGWPPAATPAAGYLNFIASYGIVTNGMANPQPCQTNIMAFSVSAGTASSSPNNFAAWTGIPTGAPPSVSIWSKTSKSAGVSGRMCPG